MENKTDFAVRIATQLRGAEAGLDQALADVSLLTHDMTRHRVGAGLAAQAGHAALIEIQAASAAMVEARSRLLAAHGLLLKDAVRLGMDLTVLVGLETKPDDRPVKTVGQLEREGSPRSSGG